MYCKACSVYVLIQTVLCTCTSLQIFNYVHDYARYTSQGKKVEDRAADKAICLFSTKIVKVLLDATTTNSKLETEATVPSVPDTPPLGHRPR